MIKDLISIIIPCHNQAPYLKETLDSVLSQSYEDWECIIVNDGSTDNTEQIAMDYCNIDERMKYVVQENKGPSVARNQGIVQSNGEYILPLDADDIIDKEYLKKTHQVMLASPETKVVFSRIRHFGEDNAEIIRGPFRYEDFIWRKYLIVCSALYKRIDYDRTLGYNPNMVYGMEDFDFWLSLIQPADVVYEIPEILFYYRIKGMSRDKISQMHQKEMLTQIILNHPDIYTPYFHNLFDFKYLEYKLFKMENSKTYKCIKKVAAPFVVIRDMLKKMKQ